LIERSDTSDVGEARSLGLRDRERKAAMTNGVSDRSSMPTSRVRTIFGPRPAVLALAASVMVAIVLVLGYLIWSSQDSSKSSARQRFVASATIRSQLTSSLLTTSSTALRTAATKIAPTTKALDQIVAASHLGYAVILTDQGSVVASSSKTPQQVLRRLGSRPAFVRQALSGRPWLSSVVPAQAGGAPTIDWAAAFAAPEGRHVLVEGFPAAALGSFLRTFVDQGSAGRSIYVIDAARNLIAASRSSGLALGARLPAPLANAPDLSSRTIGDDFVVSAPVGGTGWQIVVSQPTSSLYPALAGSRSWLLWSVVAVVAAIGLASLLLLRRWLVGSEQLALAVGQLELLNGTLEGRVEERTALAHRRLAELQRSNSELEQFASVAAHDLQEPLRKIRMYVERLGARSELGEDSRSDIVRMDSAAVRLQRLIDDLLDLARVNSRGRELVPVELDLVAAEALSDLEARRAEVGAHVEIGELPVVIGDQAQLQRVLQNLLSNALKFHRADVPLEVRVSSEVSADGRCTITVADNGIGFDDQYAERIFGAFQRLHGRSAYDGTGIGLSIARKIAWRHSGDLTATGVPDQGATFRLTLPLAQAAALTERKAA
jgi:signal transduction histidine kinase